MINLMINDKEKVTAVVDCFGGLSDVLNLCLTNSQVSSVLPIEKVTKLKQITSKELDVTYPCELIVDKKD